MEKKRRHGTLRKCSLFYYIREVTTLSTWRAMSTAAKVESGGSGSGGGDGMSGSASLSGEPNRRHLLEQLLHSQLCQDTGGLTATAADGGAAEIEGRLRESLAASIAELPPSAVISKPALAAFKTKHVAMMQAMAQEKEKKRQFAAAAAAAAKMAASAPPKMGKQPAGMPPNTAAAQTGAPQAAPAPGNAR